MRTVLFLCAFQLFLAAFAFAQVDVFGFAGARGGRDFDTGIVCIQAPCPTTGTVESGAFYGAAVDLGLTRKLGLEVTINHQSTSASALDSHFHLFEVHDTRVLGGLVFAQPIHRWEIFEVFGVGFSHMKRSIPFVDFDSTRFAGSFGGGIKWNINPRLGLRAETRLSYADWSENVTTSSDFRVDFCGGITIRLKN
jgi:hypothetical protein